MRAVKREDLNPLYLRKRLARFAFTNISGLGRRWPLLKGSDWLTRRPWVRRIAISAGPLLLAKLRSGVMIEVDVSDYDGLMVGLVGAAELQITYLCKKLLAPGDVFLDIGANYGAVGLNCIDAIGPSGAIHLFEPQKKLARAIDDAISYIPRAFLHEIALSNEETQALLIWDRGHSGSASLVPGRTGGEGEVVPVREARAFLGDLVGERSCGAKLDVEGVESLVLPGLLSLQGLKFVFFEHNVGSGEDLLRMIHSAGMVMLGLPARWLRPSPVPISHHEEMESFSDFLAIRRDNSIFIGGSGLT